MWLSLSSSTSGYTHVDATLHHPFPAQAAHEAAAGRLADLNKAIASGKKPKAKPGELRPPARERARARARRGGARRTAGAPRRLPPNVEEVPPLEPLVSAGGADYARGNKALEILNLSNNKISCLLYTSPSPRDS